MDARGFAVTTDSGADRDDMRLIEGPRERRAAMAGCPEGDALGRICRVGADRRVGVDELGDIDQIRLRRGVLPGNPRYGSSRTSLRVNGAQPDAQTPDAVR